MVPALKQHSMHEGEVQQVISVSETVLGVCLLSLPGT